MAATGFSHFVGYLLASAVVSTPLFAQELAPADGRSEDDALESEPRSEASLSPAGTLPSFAELQAQGAVIGEIRVANINVFDTANPKDDKWLFRLANRLHITTRQNIVEQQLLFKSGDPLSLQQIDESERVLRTNRYLADAEIKPIRYSDGVVDVEVRTQDVWTLNPGISLSRSGGENSYSFSVQESNLFGRGKDVMVEYESDVDRSTSMIRYSDPHLWGTWNQLIASHADNSDGTRSELSLTRPFYALNTPWAASIGGLHWDRTDSRYDLGEVVDRFHTDQQSFKISYGLSSGLTEKGVSRWTFGVGYEAYRFEADPDPLNRSIWPLPESKKFVYPTVGYEFLQDRYEERRNEQQIGRTEDIYTGLYLNASVGWAARMWGSDRSAAILALSAGGTLESEDQTRTLSAALDLAGRVEHRRLTDATAMLEVEAYWRLTPRQLVFGSLLGVATEDLDRERQVLLGGDFAGVNDLASKESLVTRHEESLRGYPLRYQDGKSMAMTTLEYRVFTDIYLLRLFRVGGAAFFDAGRTWGRGNAGGVSQGWLKDVGFGIRLGSSRSSFGTVIHLDVAFPLDGDPTIDKVQFLVQSKRSF